MHDDAYKIAKEIIFDDYNNIFEIGNLAISNIENFKTIEKYIHNDINDFVSINMCKDNIKLFTEAKNTPITTNAKIKKATRLGWELKSEAYALHSIFMKEYSMIEEINLRFWSRIERMLIISEDTKNRAVMTSSLRELLVKHDEEKLNFYKAYDNLSLYSKDITSYFNIKK
ncbi:hypothetical protein DX900_16730 [Serratia marcescens]|nr:hypothetical protein DX900_16730 [Serratia marcescens]